MISPIGRISPIESTATYGTNRTYEITKIVAKSSCIEMQHLFNNAAFKKYKRAKGSHEVSLWPACFDSGNRVLILPRDVASMFP